MKPKLNDLVRVPGEENSTHWWLQGGTALPVHADILCTPLLSRGSFLPTGRVLYTASLVPALPSGHRGGERPPRTPISTGTTPLSLILHGGCARLRCQASCQPRPATARSTLPLKSQAHTAPFYQPWPEGTSVTDPKFPEGRNSVCKS